MWHFMVACLPVFVSHAHVWILPCPRVSSSKSHCHRIAPLSSLALCVVTLVTQPHKIFPVRAVSISTDWYINGIWFFSFVLFWFGFFFSGEARHNIFNLLFNPEGMTGILILVLHLSDTCTLQLMQFCRGEQFEVNEVHSRWRNHLVKQRVKRRFCYMCIWLMTSVCTYRAHALPLLGLFSSSVTTWLFLWGLAATGYVPSDV